MKRNLIVGQSGGPTAVINSSLAGVIDYSLKQEKIGTVYGMINGIEGLLENKIMNLSATFGSNPSEINRLKLTPAMYLGSCRYKLKDDGEEYKRIIDILNKLDVGYFIYIGGNDSMDTVKKLADYTLSHSIDIKVVGIPKTIDNDLNGIDHSPGFASAAKYVASAVKAVSYDTSIYNVKSVHIIEVMGRDAGWLAASSVLARGEGNTAPHLVYLPEVEFSVSRFLDDVKAKLSEYNSIIVVVSEGIKDKNGEYISSKSDKVDEFGHSMLSGAGSYLKGVIENEIGCKVRALELSVLQRSAGHITSLTDVEEAFNLAIVAVKSALQGKTGVFSTLHRISDLPYSVEYSTEEIGIVANTEKTVPISWISESKNDVTEEMVRYLKPLIEGVVQTPYRNGMPDYIDISHLDIGKQKYRDNEENSLKE